MENLSQQHKNGISILINNTHFESVLVIAFNRETLHGHRSEQNCQQGIGNLKSRMSKRQGSVIFASICFPAHQITPLHKHMMLAQLGPAISYTLCLSVADPELRSGGMHQADREIGVQLRGIGTGECTPSHSERGFRGLPQEIFLNQTLNGDFWKHFAASQELLGRYQ